MTTFGIMIRIAAILIAIIGALLSFHMGFMWIYEGYGLNPWVAFPIGTFMIMIPAGIILWECIDTALNDQSLDSP